MTEPQDHYFIIPVQIGIICVLLLISGLFSGLVIGLMSLTPQELMLISKSGTKRERFYAEQILPVRKSGNWLLCSLLIGNVIVNSSVSILFDNLTTGILALVASSIGIFIVGELLPQAICVKNGLAVGARTIWITRFIMFVTCPFSYPIAKCLDAALGVESVSYNRKRLMELIKLTTKHAEDMAEELKIAVGAMQMTDKTVADVMTKIQDVFMLPETTILNAKTVAEILRSGYTRIPVYSSDRNNVVSLLFVKDLALLDPDDNFTVKTVCGFHEHTLRFVNKEMKLARMLEEFKKGEYHLAIVQATSKTPQNVVSDKSDSDQSSSASRPSAELLGIVTLEDIVEEILQAEIVDETDAIIDNVNRTRRRRRTQLQELDFFNYDTTTGNCAISMQMQMVTVQWLTSNHAAFQADIITRPVLERLIRQNVHKLEISNLADMKDPETVYPKSSHLYTKKVPSEKFILILEGRVFVTIGQTNMTLEAGPWHCFGKELLDKLLGLIHNKASPVSTNQPKKIISVKTPALSTLAKASKATTQQQALRQQPATAPLPSLAGGSSAGVSAEYDGRNTAFVPDYSAVIRDTCTYLEITAESFLLAYKSTLITRNRSQSFAEQQLGSVNSALKQISSRARHDRHRGHFSPGETTLANNTKYDTASEEERAKKEALSNVLDDMDSNQVHTL